MQVMTVITVLLWHMSYVGVIKAYIFFSFPILIPNIQNTSPLQHIPVVCNLSNMELENILAIHQTLVAKDLGAR